MLGRGIKAVPIEESRSPEYSAQESYPSTAETQTNSPIVKTVSNPSPEELAVAAAGATSLNIMDNETHLSHLSHDPAGPDQVPAEDDSTEETIEEMTEDPMGLEKLLELNMENSIRAALGEVYDSRIFGFLASVQVPFSYYPFVDFACLGALPSTDVAFLESQGSLHLPARILLDEFMQHYFLHIHPVLPLIDEGDFWAAYQQRLGGFSTTTLSLPVLHAMLFASCTFVCDTTVMRLGYSDIRSMRASFFRRAKLLLDFGADSSHLSSAQAALLLSFSSMSAKKKVDTSWLTSAIENARLADAPQYSATSVSVDITQKRLLKRVWWCCIIRDRSLSLLMRRPILITKDDFDFTANRLELCDFEDEFERSKVYNAATKKTLARILIRTVDLFVALTDTLALVFSCDCTKAMSPARSAEVSKCVHQGKQHLHRWYTDTSKELPEQVFVTMATTSSLVEPETPHDSIQLYMNLMFMYYHTARIILCNFEVLHHCVSQRSTGISQSSLPVIYKNLHDLQDATCGLSSCHSTLVERDLVQWLPNSAVGCTVLPLILNIIDDKCCESAFQFQSRLVEDTSPKGRQSDILVTVMKVYQTRYDSVDWIYDIVCYIVDLVMPKPDDKFTSFDWIDILAFQPALYLRLMLSVDICLSKGRFPHHDELPHRLDDASPLDIDLPPLEHFDTSEMESLGSTSGVKEHDDSLSIMADSTPQHPCSSSEDGQPTLDDFAHWDCLGLFGTLIDTL
ncbi:Cutinase transcription factor 1 beta-like protein [Fusarium keratoplasticum]|uniref:Cutinase transcription factor 1 beta-like protein n=1 Tax=Fusarium keratoplasticum TaxID=1328300 RepID=A0ACC0QD47_9HYPO|nr:Cutinase transcription factor 1 beta-like protein [Fusarium keratoplasticum]KAI8649275.1 Cutinase transcription factor 1 beta-like protein [Fusarium keratoplasticum]